MLCLTSNTRNPAAAQWGVRYYPHFRGKRQSREDSATCIEVTAHTGWVAEPIFKFITLPTTKSCYNESQTPENKESMKCSANEPEAPQSSHERTELNFAMPLIVVFVSHKSQQQHEEFAYLVLIRFVNSPPLRQNTSKTLLYFFLLGHRSYKSENSKNQQRLLSAHSFPANTHTQIYIE